MKLPSVMASPDTIAGSSSFLINRFDIKPKDSEDIASKEYTPEPYRKWEHLFKFHSWMPFYADLDQIKTDPDCCQARHNSVDPESAEHSDLLNRI